MPTVLASSRASSRVPMPAAPPTRICCISPSFMMASGSPLAQLYKNTSPQNVPGVMQYFDSVTPPSGPLGQCTMSDFSRTA